MEQFNLWDEPVREKKPSSNTKPSDNKDQEKVDYSKLSITSLSQRSLTVDSPAIHYVVLVNKACSDIMDIRRQLKFEEDKRMATAGDKLVDQEKRIRNLELHVSAAEKAIQSMREEQKEMLEAIENMLKREYADDEDDQVQEPHDPASDHIADY